MYFVVVCVLVLSYGCRACVILGHPEDTVAEVGETATLRCSTDLTVCQNHKCAIHWEHETHITFESLSVCDYVYPGYRARYSVSSGPDRSLMITGVQPSDARRY